MGLETNREKSRGEPLLTGALQRLILLHTNDLHSCFENMPKLAAAIRRYRAAEPPDAILVVDCGDHMDRMRSETEGTEGAANVAVLNAIGCEAFLPGNNEGLTFTRPQLDRMFSSARYAVLGTNLASRTGTPPAWLKRTLVLEKAGRKVGLVGVTAPYNDFYGPLGWHAEDPFASVEQAVRELRGETDLVIVLSHVGLRFDRELAARVPDVDCIVGGHTHHLLERAERAGNALIGGAGKLGTHLGVMEFFFAEGKRRPVSMRGYAVSVENEPDDEEVAALIERARAASRRALDRPAAVLTEPIGHNPLAESELGNLLADGLRRWTGAEIGLVNGGQLLGGLSAGIRSEFDLLSICPSPVNPCSLLVTGRDILEALEQSLDDTHARMEIRGYGFRGKVLGTLCASGMTVWYDAAGGARRRVVDVRVGRQPLEPERLYRVGTVDMFTFGAGYPTLGKGADTTYYLPEFLRDVLRRQLSDRRAVRMSKIPRFIPAAGHRSAFER
jgi:2',3'-cyclic-nucleotide 2'-phosphodiesterase (5'-nucleotidase family)